MDIDWGQTKRNAKMYGFGLGMGLIFGIPTGMEIRNKYLENKFGIEKHSVAKQKPDSLLKANIYGFDK